jgi:hypothetical protein
MRGQCLIPLKPTPVFSKSMAAAQHIAEVCLFAKLQSFTASEVRQIGPASSSLYTFSLPVKPPAPLSAQPSHAKTSSRGIPATSKTHIGSWPRLR